MRKTLTLLLLISITLFSCKKEKLEKIDQTTNKSLSAKTDFKDVSNFTGREIFEGIFFYDGEISERIDFIREFKQQIIAGYATSNRNIEELDTLKNEVTNIIQTISPNYFTQLKSSIIEQDHYSLKNLLIEGHELYNQALLISPTFSEQFKMTNKALKNINISDYDFTNTKEISRFQEDVESAYMNNGGELCQMGLVMAFVVAIAGMETIAVVNSAVVATVFAWVYGLLPIFPADSDGNLDYFTNAIITELHN